MFTLQEFWHKSSGKDKISVGVVGDCLAGAGIEDGYIAEVNLTKMPMPPKYKKHDGVDYFDICLCYGSPVDGNPPIIMLKEYDGNFFGMQHVGTRYKQKDGEEYRMNFTFEPIAIFGVVYACYDHKGVLKWVRDVENHPDRLTTKSTVRGGNVSGVYKIPPKKNKQKTQAH